MKKRIYNIPASCPFVDVLARNFLAEYRDNSLELADVLFLLPNRRACQSLREAFVREQGLAPTLLPQMRPIADVEEDALFVAGFDASEVLPNLPPAIDAVSRLLWFTRRIMDEPGKFGLEKFSAAQACFLAQELCSLADQVQNEELSFQNLQKLVPEEYAAHWLETLDFLELITAEWPQFLKSKGLVDVALRRCQIMDLQCALWQKYPPQKRIVIAGTTATFPYMKRLVQVVLNLPRGEVVLSGLDKELDNQAWEAIDEVHPQFELKDLLNFLQIDRQEVEDLLPPENPPRESLISELMRPAKTTDKWRQLADCKWAEQATDGLRVIDCADVRQEALSIALIMRQVLETPEKTAALVTTDRNLARRVAAELARWEIKVDDSAGCPLHLTPVGAFLRLMAAACAEEDAIGIEKLSLLKHPFMAMGKDYGALRREVRDYEKLVLRTDKPEDNLPLAEELEKELKPLADLLRSREASFKEILKVHIQTAEKLATTPLKDGTSVLWKGDAGEAAARFVADLFAQAEMLGEVVGDEYGGLLDALMAQVTVRPRYGTHPRLKILGPIEARLNRFDIMIIGEVNEGAWPKPANADPWMSRPMKKDFGLPTPEKAIGVLAADLAQFMAAPKVFLTRAERVQGTPMVKSRWWMRLATVLKAAGAGIEELTEREYPQQAEKLDEADKYEPINPSAPCPPVDKRPRELSVSAIEQLMRDPYIIFAKYILRLKPLKDLNPEAEFFDYGNIVHEVLDEFNKKYNTDFPANGKEELLALGKKYFASHEIAMETRAFWWPNFVKSIDWLADKEREYRQEIKQVHSEVKGQIVLNAPEGPFVLKARADRVDETKDGRVNVIDYKTGQARSIAEMKKGYAPQLPLEGVIAEHGGFEGIAKKEVAKLLYWQPAKKETVVDDAVEEILTNNLEKAHKLIAMFDLPTTPYISQPNPKYAPKYSDYEHLARIAEWKVVEEGGEE